MPAQPLDESQHRLEDLRAQARYHRERHQLYLAKVHASRPTSLARLRELERARAAAEARLAHAEAEQERPGGPA